MRSLFVLLLAVTMVGCGDEVLTTATGSIEVSVSTSGEGTDDDGYVVNLDSGGSTSTLEANGSVTLTVEEGTHTVELTEVADACSVTTENPVTVSVAADETATAEFAVSCTAA